MDCQNQKEIWVIEEYKEEKEHLESEKRTLQYHNGKLINACLTLEHHVTYWKKECTILRKNPEDRHHLAVNFELTQENQALMKELAKLRKEKDNFRELWLDSISVNNELKAKLEKKEKYDF